MPCYIEHIRPPSEAEYIHWQRLGFLGSWEDYCRVKDRGDGGAFFVCGELGEHCADCAGVAEFLCDYPVGDGKTCDRPMCADHAREVAPDVHYCDAHHKMWQEFRSGGGEAEVLKNVIPYSRSKKR